MLEREDASHREPTEEATAVVQAKMVAAKQAIAVEAGPSGCVWDV